MKGVLLVLLAISGIRSHGSVDQALLDEIKSNPHWHEDDIAMCTGDTIGVPGLQCHIYRIFLYTVKVEVRSLDPFLIVLKEFIPIDYADEFLEQIAKKDQEIMQTFNSDTGEESATIDRKANGTYYYHHEFPIVSKIFNHIHQRFSSIDFRAAEDYNVMSYTPGGHYAPHYDATSFESEEIANSYDWYRTGGNRLLTFLFVMQTAEKGGGTIFPFIATTVQPSKGDAIVWLNIDAEYGDQLLDSWHGACPIWKGTKIAATLWVSVKGNELVLPCTADKQFDIEKLLHPTEKQLLYKRDWNCRNGCYAM